MKLIIKICTCLFTMILFIIVRVSLRTITLIRPFIFKRVSDGLVVDSLFRMVAMDISRKNLKKYWEIDYLNNSLSVTSKLMNDFSNLHVEPTMLINNKYNGKTNTTFYSRFGINLAKKYHISSSCSFPPKKKRQPFEKLMLIGFSYFFRNLWNDKFLEKIYQKENVIKFYIHGLTHVSKKADTQTEKNQQISEVVRVDGL